MKRIFLFLLVFLLGIPGIYAQSDALKPTIDRPVYFDVSPPLRDMYQAQMKPIDKSWKELGVIPNKFNSDGENPDYLGLYNKPDPGLQDYFGPLLTDTTIANFEGIAHTNSVPPDTYGEAGMNYYFQVVNTSYAIFNKTGEIIFGPLPSHSVWMGMPNNDNSGDAVVLYDEIADRWLFTQFSLPNYPSGPFFQMIAISQTSDPTGSWYRYQYEFPLMPDYPHFGVWEDGYYMSSNNFGNYGFANNGAYGYDRTAMLAGDPDAVRIAFTLIAGGSSGSGFSTFYPADCDGTFPPAGTPSYFGFIKRNGGTQYFGIYEFHADFVDPANSTFGNLLSLNVIPFNGSINGISQKGTSVRLDDLSDRFMYRLQFRQFENHASMVVNHTVNLGGNVGGLRWYELRKTTGDWSIYQESTYAPADGHSRWMGSIAMDTAGSIALGYSISSSSLYPSIRYTGRLATDPLNQMTVAERSIIEGGGSQTGMWGNRSRWGDYSGMCVDPANPTTFWYTTEYYPTTAGSSWHTRIGAFSFQEIFSTAASATPAKFCLGEDTVQLDVLAWGGSGSYSYSWTSIPSGFTSNLQNPTVVPTDTTQYIVATSDGAETRYDTALVKVVYPQEAYAGNDTAICAWEPSIDLHGVAAYYRSFVWGTFGDGTFSDKYELETTYYPGSDDRTSGGVNLVLVAFAESPCTGMVMDSMYLVIDPCTGIEDQLSGTLRLSLHPNPAQERVSVLVYGISQATCRLTITGVDGRMYHSGTFRMEGERSEEVIDLSGFSKGIYFVQVKTESGVLTERLVIQ